MMKGRNHFRQRRMKTTITHRRWEVYLFILFFVIPCLSCAWPQRSAIEKEDHPAGHSAESQFQEAAGALAKGDLKAAGNLFDQAAAGFEGKKDLAGQCKSLLKSAHIRLSLGHTDQAADHLQMAEEIARKIDNQRYLGQIYALRGNIYHISGETRRAVENMEKAVSMGKKSGYQKLLIAVHNDLGNLYGDQKMYPKALSAYKTSAALARNNGEPLRAAIAFTNAGRILLTMGDEYSQSSTENSTRIKSMGEPRANTRKRGTLLYGDNPSADENSYAPQKAAVLFGKAAAMLTEAEDILPAAPACAARITAQINLGSACLDLAQRDRKAAARYRAGAYNAFDCAVKLAEASKNYRLLSYAKGYSGLWHKKENRLDPALLHTEEAIYYARMAQTPESLYRWQWQYADILSLGGRTKEAVSAYEAAIATLESVQIEFSNCYGMPRAELRKAADKLYPAYVDLLLKGVDGAPPAEQQQILKIAGETLEKRKVFELRDYFNDDCLGANLINGTGVEELIHTAVVVYPIILPDRLEIVALFPSDGSRERAGGSSASKGAIRRHYTTPVDSETVSREAEVFRRALAAADSSKSYLTHSRKLYDWIVRPIEQDLTESDADTLVFIPDGPLRNIPMGALHDGLRFLIQSYAVAVTPGLVLTDPKPLDPERIHMLAVGISAAAKGFEPLPGVAEEIESLASLYKVDTLMDSRFSLNNFRRALGDASYNVVHIASHGKFDDEIEKSFLLAYDAPLTFNDLSSFVGLYRFREQPLELLTLSACETAAGNEEAGLGMAGLAVKIGARSALATLWAVDDRAAAKLVAEFYRNLQKTGNSRAMALQKAKLKLIDDPIFTHPGYWSPFILINNWL